MGGHESLEDSSTDKTCEVILRARVTPLRVYWCSAVQHKRPSALLVFPYAPPDTKGELYMQQSLWCFKAIDTPVVQQQCYLQPCL